MLAKVVIDPDQGCGLAMNEGIPRWRPENETPGGTENRGNARPPVVAFANTGSEAQAVHQCPYPERGIQAVLLQSQGCGRREFQVLRRGIGLQVEHGKPWRTEKRVGSQHGITPVVLIIRTDQHVLCPAINAETT